MSKFKLIYILQLGFQCSSIEVNIHAEYLTLIPQNELQFFNFLITIIFFIKQNILWANPTNPAPFHGQLHTCSFICVHTNCSTLFRVFWLEITFFLVQIMPHDWFDGDFVDAMSHDHVRRSLNWNSSEAENRPPASPATRATWKVREPPTDDLVKRLKIHFLLCHPRTVDLVPLMVQITAYN